MMRVFRGRYQFIVLCFWIFLSSGIACAQEPSLGASEDHVRSPLDYGFTEWGLAKDASYNILKNKATVKGAQLIFSRKTGQIEWYGVLSQKGAWKNTIPIKGFDVVWIAPHGTVFFSENIKPKTSMMISSKLKIGQVEPGIWTVRVLKKDKVIDERRFKIIP